MSKYLVKKYLKKSDKYIWYQIYLVLKYLVSKISGVKKNWWQKIRGVRNN